MSEVKTLAGMEIFDKLNKAQDLLSDIYHFACETGNKELESLMSVADSCIIEAIDKVL